MFGLKSLRIGRAFGIDVEVHASWLIIFALMSLTLSVSVFPQLRNAAEPGVIDFVAGFTSALLFFGSVLVHELAHSLVGRRFGVEIRKITLFIFGGLAQMSSEAADPKAEFLMAAAGPASSIALALVFGALDLVLALVGVPAWVRAPLGYLAFVNVAVALFNLVPGFPLDGGRLLRSVLWGLMGDMDRATRIATRMGQVFAGLLIAFGAAQLLARQDPVNGFWFVLIGFFLYSAATSSYEQVAVAEALAGVKVREIMTEQVVTVPGHVVLADLINDYFLRHRHGRFPVMEAGRIIGTVTLHDVREIPQQQWATTLAREAATMLSEDDFIGADEAALAALMRMAQTGRGQLLVRDGSDVAGIVTKSDVLSAIQVRDMLRPTR